MDGDGWTYRAENVDGPLLKDVQQHDKTHMAQLLQLAGAAERTAIDDSMFTLTSPSFVFGEKVEVTKFYLDLRSSLDALLKLSCRLTTLQAIERAATDEYCFTDQPHKTYGAASEHKRRYVLMWGGEGSRVGCYANIFPKKVDVRIITDIARNYATSPDTTNSSAAKLAVELCLMFHLANKAKEFFDRGNVNVVPDIEPRKFHNGRNLNDTTWKETENDLFCEILSTQGIHEETELAQPWSNLVLTAQQNWKITKFAHDAADEMQAYHEALRRADNVPELQTLRAIHEIPTEQADNKMVELLTTKVSITDLDAYKQLSGSSLNCTEFTDPPWLTSDLRACAWSETVKREAPSDLNRSFEQSIFAYLMLTEPPGTLDINYRKNYKTKCAELTLSKHKFAKVVNVNTASPLWVSDLGALEQPLEVALPAPRYNALAILGFHGDIRRDVFEMGVGLTNDCSLNQCLMNIVSKLISRTLESGPLSISSFEYQLKKRKVSEVDIHVIAREIIEAV